MSDTTYQEIPLSRLHESPLNPRKTFAKGPLDELAASIKAKGIIDPLIVRPNKDGFEIAAGNRRYRAAKLAGLEAAPAIVRPLSWAQSEVWEANGNHCSFCGKSRALCERLGIGLTAQHVVPFAEAGDEWPLIPFCSRCQQQSAAALAETRRVQETVGGLDEIIQRIQKNNPELLG
jgi:hypothetical protein